MEEKKTGKEFYTNKYFKKMPDFKKRKNQALTSVFLTLTALSFFGLFAINPTLSTIAGLQKQLADAKTVDKKLNEKIKNLNILAEEYIGLESNMPSVLRTIPQTPNAPLLLGQIYAIAAQSQLTINTLGTFQVELSKSQEGADKYSSYGFTLEGRGTYENITDFISQLTKMERIVTIDNVSIDKGSGKGDYLKLILKGKTYFKR